MLFILMGLGVSSAIKLHVIPVIWDIIWNLQHNVNFVIRSMLNALHALKMMINVRAVILNIIFNLILVTNVQMQFQIVNIVTGLQLVLNAIQDMHYQIVTLVHFLIAFIAIRQLFYVTNVLIVMH